MKKLFLFVFLLVNSTFSLMAQQTIDELVKDCISFVDTKAYLPEQVIEAPFEDGTMGQFDLYKLSAVFNLNVFSYYNLRGYDTDLKKELFKETDEFKEYEAELKDLREYMKGTNYYYIHKFRGNYNLEKGGFPYEIELYEGSYVSFPGYINHGTLCIEYATKRFPKNKIDVVKRWGGRDYFYNQKTFLPVKDKTVASKIEDAGSNKAVLFVFKIDSLKNEKILFSTNTFVITKTVAVYIVNTQTGEVYCKVL